MDTEKQRSGGGKSSNMMTAWFTAIPWNTLPVKAVVGLGLAALVAIIVLGVFLKLKAWMVLVMVLAAFGLFGFLLHVFFRQSDEKKEERNADFEVGSRNEFNNTEFKGKIKTKFGDDNKTDGLKVRDQ